MTLHVLSFFAMTAEELAQHMLEHPAGWTIMDRRPLSPLTILPLEVYLDIWMWGRDPEQERLTPEVLLLSAQEFIEANNLSDTPLEGLREALQKRDRVELLKVASSAYNGAL